MLRVIKSLIIFTILFNFVFSITTYAANPGKYIMDDNDTSTSTAKYADFNELQGIFNKIFNIALISAGGAFVAMVAYGVWKSSLAAGDPRGLEGAKSTWTYALYGFFIVVGVFAILLIIASILGVSPFSPGGLVAKLMGAINELLGVQGSPSNDPSLLQNAPSVSVNLIK
jgi:hypothetical protein